MSTDAADALTTFLGPEIEAGLLSVRQERNLIRYKQIGLDYIAACKELSSDANGLIDVVVLKQKILDAVSLLQQYHDALPSS